MANFCYFYCGPEGQGFNIAIDTVCHYEIDANSTTQIDTTKILYDEVGIRLEYEPRPRDRLTV